MVHITAIMALESKKKTKNIHNYVSTDLYGNQV